MNNPELPLSRLTRWKPGHSKLARKLFSSIENGKQTNKIWNRYIKFIYIYNIKFRKSYFAISEKFLGYHPSGGRRLSWDAKILRMRLSRSILRNKVSKIQILCALFRATASWQFITSTKFFWNHYIILSFCQFYTFYTC